MRSDEQMFTRLLFSCVYLLYLDDAGSPGNPAEEYFVLGGVCVYEAQVERFSRELAKLATPYDKNPEDVEFHASMQATSGMRNPSQNAIDLDLAAFILSLFNLAG